MSAVIIQLVLLVLAAPWWWPVLRRIVADTWSASEPGAAPLGDDTLAPAQARGQRGPRSVWPTGGPGFGERRLRNQAWDIGRRPPRSRSSGFGQRPR